jgi:hypothetical protein
MNAILFPLDTTTYNRPRLPAERQLKWFSFFEVGSRSVCGGELKYCAQTMQSNNRFIRCSPSSTCFVPIA